MYRSDKLCPATEPLGTELQRKGNEASGKVTISNGKAVVNTEAQRKSEVTGAMRWKGVTPNGSAKERRGGAK